MAERVELRLQIGPVGVSHLNSGHTKTILGRGYRFARPNGWHCGCWHPTVGQAAECIELKPWKP